MPATLIRTATDFRTVITFHDYAIWNLTHFPPQDEPRVREHLDEIFADLQYLEQGDAEQMSVFLEGIAGPLGRLWELGCGIMGLVTRGTMRLNGGTEINDWVRTHYFVIPIDGCFRIGDELTTTVHQFNPNCEEAIRVLHEAVTEGHPVASWPDRRAVTVDYEGRVPWCAQCLVEGMKQDRNPGFGNLELD